MLTDKKQMIYIAVLCNPKITAGPLYSTPLFIGPYAAANNTALLAWRHSQGTKLYCLVNRGTFSVNNLPRVVARIMPRSESNPRPLDHAQRPTATPPSHRYSIAWIKKIKCCITFLFSTLGHERIRFILQDQMVHMSTMSQLIGCDQLEVNNNPG